MKKSIIKFSVALAIAAQPSVLYAGTGVESTASTNNSSVKDSADKSQSANKGAQAQQIISAGMMFAMAAMQKPSCSSGNGGACAMMAAMIGMGVLSLAQSKEHAAAANSAGYTSGQTDGLGNNPYDYSKVDIKDLNNPANSDPNVKAMGSNLKKLSDVVDKNGNIKTPDGKSYKASDFSSQSAMAAAGVPNGAALGALAAYDAVQKKAAAKVDKMKIGASTEAMGFDEGGGSGGGANAASSSDSGAGYAAAAAAPVGLVRDPSSLAGMQKNYNGEPIGVAADSIFLMMNRRYKVKESQESFFNESDLLLQK